MADNDSAVWCVRAGRLGEADNLFLQHAYVALGWSEMGDMSQLPNDPDRFKETVHKIYPEYKPGAIPVAAGQLRRFVYDIKPGDLAIYPSRLDRQVHIGRIVG